MKHNALRRLSLLLAVIMVVGVAAACGGNATPSGAPATQPPAADTADTPTAAPATEAPAAVTEAPADVPDPAAVADDNKRNLNGREIVIADWWTNNDAEEQPPANLREEEIRDYQDRIYEEYNFEILRRSVSDWGGYLELFTTSVMAGSPAADMFIMSSPWAMQLQLQGLLYPLNTVESVTLTDPKWNPALNDLFTADGNVYAITSEFFIEPRNFLFFNKRMFEDAGIDPEEPYDLQARGEWTWDAFMDYCERLTRDTNGDGTTDVYAIVGFEIEAAQGFLFSNNAQHIKKNDDGSFYNAMNEPEFLEAMQFVKSINERGYWCPAPEGSEWDWFVTGFHDGHAAMIIREVYSTGTWEDMTDDWGVLFTPKGPRATDYNTYFQENVYCLPHNLSAEDADEIMFAYNLYTEPLQYDVENPDYWKDGAYGYNRFRDTRTVDETLTMFYEGLYEPSYRDYVPGIDWGPTWDWGSVLGAETVNEKVEAAKPVVDAAIAEVNK